MAATIHNQAETIRSQEYIIRSQEKTIRSHKYKIERLDTVLYRQRRKVDKFIEHLAGLYIFLTTLTDQAY